MKLLHLTIKAHNEKEPTEYWFKIKTHWFIKFNPFDYVTFDGLLTSNAIGFLMSNFINIGAYSSGEVKEAKAEIIDTKRKYLTIDTYDFL